MIVYSLIIHIFSPGSITMIGLPAFWILISVFHCRVYSQPPGYNRLGRFLTPGSCDFVFDSRDILGFLSLLESNPAIMIKGAKIMINKARRRLFAYSNFFFNFVFRQVFFPVLCFSSSR